MADPMGVDFRTLTLLARVHDLRSFTKAAEELGVNQSAISYTVEKLRGVFQDPLFVRQGRTILPTPRCDEIVQEANRLIGDFRRLTVPSQFDPGTVKRKITIACNYYERVLWVPHIVRAVRAEAPGLELEIVDASDIGHERLLRGDGGHGGRRVCADADGRMGLPAAGHARLPAATATVAACRD